MIRVQTLAEGGQKDILRLFHDDSAPDGAPFDGQCVVHWVDDTSMWVHGLTVRNGRMGRKWLLEVLEYGERHGAVWIKSKRTDGHVLPGGEVQPNGDIWVAVQAMRAR